MKFLSIVSFCLLSFFSVNAQNNNSTNDSKDTYLKWFINYRITISDIDKDGAISKEEIKADKDGLWGFYAIPQNFTFTDKNESGTLDVNELRAMRYREEGASLQKQADAYDKAVETYGFKSISKATWLKENTHVAKEIMSNYEWLSANRKTFNEIAKTNWLGLNDEIVTDITKNYFLLLRRPDLGKMLQTRYPRQMSKFVKTFMRYHNIKSKSNDDVVVKGSKLSADELQKAANSPKRSFKN